MKKQYILLVLFFLPCFVCADNATQTVNIPPQTFNWTKLNISVYNLTSLYYWENFTMSSTNTATVVLGYLPTKPLPLDLLYDRTYNYTVQWQNNTDSNWHYIDAFNFTPGYFGRGSWFSNITDRNLAVSTFVFTDANRQLTSTASGILNVANGGSGRASDTAFSLIAGGATTTAAQVSIANGNNGTMLTSNGPLAYPIYSNCTYIEDASKNLTISCPGVLFGNFNSSLPTQILGQGGYLIFGGDTLTYNENLLFNFEVDNQTIINSTTGVDTVVLNIPTFNVNNTFEVSPLGGQNIYIKTSQTVNRGTVMKVNDTVADLFSPVLANDDMPVCTVYDTSITANSYGWCTTDGRGYLLVTATNGLGNICYVSASVAGKADCSATIPAVAFHNREIGHTYVVNDTTGLTKAVLHWN